MQVRRLGWSFVLPVAFALLACQIFISLALVPPWQQPDESTHVARVELQRNRIALLDGSPDAAREGEILQSMAHYDWWDHRRRRSEAPIVIPKDFSSTAYGVAVPAETFARPTAYTLFAGRLLSWLPRLPIVEDLYVLRAISAVFGMLTLWIAWLGARECLGMLGGTIVAVLLALHPQFAVVSTAAAADALVNLFGACVWWQATLAVRRTHSLLPLTGVWGAAIAAASADRMGVPLLAFAVAVSIVVIARRAESLTRPLAVTFVVFALVAAAWVLDTSGETYGLVDVFRQDWLLADGSRSWSFFARFTSGVHQSWWFSLGWGRYAPPSWWMAVAITLTAIAAVGTGRQLLSGGAPDASRRTLIALAVVGVTLQVAAVYWTYFRLGHGAQGKSLFPVLVPCLVLLWSGIESWVPPPRRVRAAATLVVLIALLDAAAWGLVAIPAYYASF
jgi:hypothetical protein